MKASGAPKLIDPHLYRSFCFRGEGRANFVISAKCETTGIRIAWRFPKHRKSGTVSTKPKSRVVIAYLEKLIVPFLGRQYLVEPEIVEFDSLSVHHLAKIPSLPLNDKVEGYEELCDNSRYPASMSFFPLYATKEVERVSALQMIDATKIPKLLSPKYFGPTITVEIKPKQGFLQQHPGLQLPYCNNCILQLEKCHSAAFDQMYDFCPLDLFSGDLRRMRKALNSLISVPHRNLRIFLDGTVIHSDEILLADEELRQKLSCDASVSVEQLITALCCVLVGSPSDEPFSVHSSSVLSKLLEGQHVDTIGLVRAYQIYTNLPHSVQMELLDKCLLPRNGLSFLRKNTQRAQLERYLLAATMKDCSLMISLRLLHPEAFTVQCVISSGQQIVRIRDQVCDGDNKSNCRSTTYPSEIAFAYSVKVVDLDPKSPKNLLNAYQRFMSGINIIEEAPDLRRPCII